jgi:hypothetical protein
LRIRERSHHGNATYLKVGRVRGGRGADASGMNANTTSTCYPEIDDRFWDAWIEFGMIQLDAYLASHARFAHYCDRRDAPGLRRLESAILRVGRDSLD